MKCSVKGCQNEPYTIYDSETDIKGIPICKEHNMQFIESIPVLKLIKQVEEIVNNA